MKKEKKPPDLWLITLFAYFCQVFLQGIVRIFTVWHQKDCHVPEIASHKQLHVIQLMASSEASSKATLFGFWL